MTHLRESKWTRSITKLAAIAISFYGASTASGATIFIADFLNNPSFESPVSTGTPPVLCPTSWTCGGSPAPGAGAYTVTSDQYTAGSDGLSGGRIVPDGIQAAFSPTTIEGSGDLFQSIPSLLYVAGNTYTISFYVGLPNSEPGGPSGCNIPNVSCVVNAFPQTVQFNFTSGPTIAANGIPGPFAINSPGQGQWALVTQSFTAQAGAAYIGTQVGIDFHVVTSNNNQAVNFDIPAAGVPEPGAAGLMGGGLVLTGLIGAWRKLRANRAKASV